MPIKDLTDKVDISQGLPLIARINKGAEQETKVSKKTGREYKSFGKDLDYFRITFEPQFEYLKPLWLDLYGERPTFFENVYLTAPTVDIAFATWKEEWTATTMMHRCDGEHQVQWYSKAAQSYSTAKEKCAANTANPCACTNIGRLNLLLMDFLQVSNILGTFLATTHSINDILTVYRRLAATEALYGTLSNVPFVFGRADKDIRAPKPDKDGEIIGRMNITKSLFYMHIAPDFTEDKILPMIKAGNAWFKEGSQPLVMQPGAAVNLLNSGKATGGRRIGEVAQTSTQPSQIMSDTEEPIHPDPTPLTRLSDAFKGVEMTIAHAATVLNITNTEDIEEWRKHGKTPNEIIEKIIETEKASKPNPFSGKPVVEVKTVSGTVLDEGQKEFDAIHGANDKVAQAELI